MWTLFCSSHRFFMRFGSGDCYVHGKTFILWAVNYSVVYFEMRFRSLSCWKFQTTAQFKPPARVSHVVIFYPCFLSSCSRSLEEN